MGGPGLWGAEKALPPAFSWWGGSIQAARGSPQPAVLQTCPAAGSSCPRWRGWSLGPGRWRTGRLSTVFSSALPFSFFPLPEKQPLPPRINLCWHFLTLHTARLSQQAQATLCPPPRPPSQKDRRLAPFLAFLGRSPLGRIFEEVEDGGGVM